MNRNPKISVVIPVFNGAEYIGQAIESILRQTYKNFEIIVINDGSNDDGKTRNVISSFGDKVRYYEKENGGVSSALNMGIRKMTGEYFAWLSHDDLFCETKFENQIAAIFASGNENTIVHGNYILFNDDLGKSITTNYEKYYPMDQICSSVFLLFWGEIHFSSFLFHKKHFERVGLFDETLQCAQDNDFIYRLCCNQKIAFIQSPVSKVRLHAASGTSCFHGKVDAENKELYLLILERLCKDRRKTITNQEVKLYAKLGGIIHSMGGEDEIRAMKKKLFACGCLELQDAAETKALKERELIIFGAGQYGRRLKFELEVRGIPVQCFVDNADDKDGQMIDSIPCFKVEHLYNHPGAVVIVAQKFHILAAEQLSAMKIKGFLLKDEVDSVLLRY